tara:strand:+ start:3425 stop:3871 length:447 start_codon:yes stop_codon:yes gene_type:complete
MKFNYKLFTIYVLSFLYIIVGIKHFTNPNFFITIVPDIFTYKKELVFISGFFEILFGCFILFKKLRMFGCWGLILLLIAVFPANIYLYVSDLPREILNISKAQALIRLPFQIPLIFLAYWHSKDSFSNSYSITCGVLFIPTMIYFLSI